VAFTADDLSPRVWDQELVLIADSGRTENRGTGQDLPTGTGLAAAWARPEERERAALEEPARVVAGGAPVRLTEQEIQAEARTWAAQAHRGKPEEVPWEKEPVQVKEDAKMFSHTPVIT
jgi:hypothetical protein